MKQREKMRPSIKIGEAVIAPGRRMTVELPISRLFNHSPVNMPVHVIHGKKEGPCLFVSAAIHGDEINGVEIVRRLLNLKLMNSLQGTLLAIPIVNVYGFINCSRYLPDRRDLNRSFPGTLKGSLAARLARTFMDEIVEKSTHGIDIHSGSNHRMNLPQVRVTLKDPAVEALAQAFGAPVIINARLRDNSLREAVIDKGIPMILYEGGESLRFNEAVIQTGLKGIVSVMRKIGMLHGRIRKKKAVEPIIVNTTTWVRAPKSGIFHSAVPLGVRVTKNDVIASVGDPFGEKEDPVISPTDGIVIGYLQLPLVHKGDALFHLATVQHLEHLENVNELNGFMAEEPFDESKL